MNNANVDAIESFLASNYPFLFNPKASLIRSYTNDVYLVESGNEKFVLKVYGARWRSDDEILFEIDLLNHLKSRGIKVAGTVAATSGKVLNHIEVDGNRHQVVLFDFAAGDKPTPPFSIEMYYQEGVATAAMHLAADDFSTVYQRRELDLNFLIEQPINLVNTLHVTDEVKSYISQFGRHLSKAIEEFASKGLDWGICHGDLTFDNFHITNDGQTVWYDFDSGGFGWRAIDIQGWVATNPAMLERQNVFIEGYRTVRELSQNDVNASPYVFAAQEVWGIQVELERRVIVLGKSAVQELLAKEVEKLKAWQKLFGFNIG